MIKCAVIGYWFIIDASIKSKIKESILNLLVLDKSLQIYVLDKGVIGGGKFSIYCKEIIKDLQESNPDKNIVLINVAASDDKNKSVLCPLGNLSHMSYGLREYRLGKWIIDQSDYFLCYVYSSLDYYRLMQLYNYAIQHNKKILNLAEDTTSKKIYDKVNHILDDRERYIYLQRLDKQKTLMSLSQELGVSSSRIRYIYNRAIIKIVNNIIKELYF